MTVIVWDGGKCSLQHQARKSAIIIAHIVRLCMSGF
jgi:hypothetical protein